MALDAQSLLAAHLTDAGTGALILETDSSVQAEPVLSVPNESDLHKALMLGVLSCNLGIPLGEQNAPFERPTDGALWGLVGVEALRKTIGSIGPGGYDVHEGTLTVVLYAPRLSGTAALRAMETRLAEGLRIGRVLSFAATTAIVVGSGAVRDAPASGTLYSRAVEFSWQAHLTRPS
jgi:hypothetical protein